MDQRAGDGLAASRAARRVVPDLAESSTMIPPLQKAAAIRTAHRKAFGPAGVSLFRVPPDMRWSVCGGEWRPGGDGEVALFVGERSLEEVAELASMLEERVGERGVDGEVGDCLGQGAVEECICE